MVFNGITSLLQVLEEKNKQGDKVKELENQLEQALIEKEELEKKQEECEIVFGKRISKKELQARIHRNVDELTCDYNLEREDVYNFLYEKFSLQHPFVNFKEQKEKTKLEYLMQNNYGRELLEILLQKDFIPSEFKKVK
jgi:glycerol-3-phosphate dehydrogenase